MVFLGVLWVFRKVFVGGFVESYVEVFVGVFLEVLGGFVKCL